MKGGRREAHPLYPGLRSCLFLKAGLAGTGCQLKLLLHLGRLSQVGRNLDPMLLLWSEGRQLLRVSVIQLL